MSRLSPVQFYAEHADDMAEERSEDGLRPRYRALRDYFLTQVPGDHILDAGCGHGRDVEYFVEQGFDAVGVDLADGMVEYAAANKRGEFHRMDLRDIAFDDATFDGIWASASLFFLPPDDIPAALPELHRVLGLSGVLQANFKEGSGTYEKERWGDTVVEHHFSDAEIREMLDAAGFTVLSFTRNQSPGGNRFLNYLCRRI
ncbi:MAG: class I SAM-dependent methyltransferase [Candidatus Nanohaloarchaea archaeon]|nr:class I SAM-dependent methyltransferase [Candidatus Nanohaloarchaea archaeon]